MIALADTDYQYDSLGNQIRERGIGVQTERAFNQLTSFSKDGVLTQYDYDPLGAELPNTPNKGKSTLSGMVTNY